MNLRGEEWRISPFGITAKPNATIHTSLFSCWQVFVILAQASAYHPS